MLNISVPGDKSGEYLALRLDHLGISLSTKSACREGEAASHVVAALGGLEWRAKNTLRFSLGTMTTAKDIKRAIQALQEILPVPAKI
jgi:cysteine sulfinate desulfinase/cysteine desulfurase-like protein